MTNDVSTFSECITNTTRTRNGLARFWPRTRGRGWGDPHTRYSGSANVAVSLSRVPR